ncbi:hypothetical protein [Amycolatopsis australiensis]|uniref:hypothetical protein n=1 Tax=Amycolatopsis australiensis TaxID=546364 RepID=UPI0011615555|nr:hypothetical protein [Amycolatopsis australiensis]
MITQRIDPVPDPWFGQRVWALTAGLRRRGLAGTGTMLVVTCEAHDADRAVATSAAERTGLRVTQLDPASAELVTALETRPTVVLACREGSARVAATRVPCRIFGDHPGMAWWRLLELAHADGAA